MEEKYQKLYQERWDRLQNAVNHGPVKDKLPVVIMGHIPCAKLADPTIITADIVERPEYFMDKAFEGLESLKDVDSTNVFLGGYGKTSGLSLLASVKTPGVDPEMDRDAIQQIDEHPHMSFEDYSKMFDMGWPAFKQQYIDTYLKLTPQDFADAAAFRKMAAPKHEALGYVEFSGVPHPSGWDMLSAMRGMNNFFRDVRRTPEVVHQALDAMVAADWDNYLKMLAGPVTTFACMCQPAVRANCSFVSRKTYEEFVWPNVVKFANAIMDAGRTVHFHYDAKWDDFLDLYTDFPKNRCIFDSDGLTDINLVKKYLGDTMAITGNVPPSLLSIGNPDDIYNYVVNQVKDLGAEGYIVCSSCTLPANTKPENLKAMVAACREF